MSRNANAPNFLPEVPNDCAFIGIETQFVVGGKNASLYEFPYAVMIGYDTPRRITYGCGGSLINRWYVLSAAHCFGSRLPDAIEVRVGELNVEEDPDCEDNDCAPRVQKVFKELMIFLNDFQLFIYLFQIKIESVTIHEDFSVTAPGIPNDIALVRLATPARLGPSVRPVCLPIKPDKILKEALDKDLDLKKSLVGQTAIVVGWGRISPFDNGQLIVRNL